MPTDRRTEQMSQRTRETRDSHSRRSQKSERESSPKRIRRDGKPATERTSSTKRNLGITSSSDHDQKHRRQLQDGLPLEAPGVLESKMGLDSEKKEPDRKTEKLPEGNKHDRKTDKLLEGNKHDRKTDKLLEGNKHDRKTDRLLEGNKHASDPIEVARSFFQHDERGQAAHSAARRPTERGSDTKDRLNDIVAEKTGSHDIQKRRDRTQPRPDDGSSWRHDGFFKLEGEAPSSRKRPAFREKKVPPEAGNASGTRKEEKGASYLHGMEKPEKPDVVRSERIADQVRHRGEVQRASFPSRERFGIRNGVGGRDQFQARYSERNNNHRTGFRVEKWKHDLFDETNKNPTANNEEDQIAKVEALLAL